MNEVMSMEERIARKLNSNKAFTLAETLLAVLILLMVSTIVATGIPVARNAYEKVVLASNAEVLLSTTISTLRNELGTAMNVDIPGGTTDSNVKTGTEVSYYNSARGSSSKISMESGGTDIQFQRYYSAEGLSKGSDPVNLISDKTATNNLHVTFGTVKYNQNTGIVTFSDLAVKRDSTTFASRDELSIRVISFTGD